MSGQPPLHSAFSARGTNAALLPQTAVYRKFNSVRYQSVGRPAFDDSRVATTRGPARLWVLFALWRQRADSKSDPFVEVRFPARFVRGCDAVRGRDALTNSFVTESLNILGRRCSVGSNTEYTKKCTRYHPPPWISSRHRSTSRYHQQTPQPLCCGLLAGSEGRTGCDAYSGHSTQARYCSRWLPFTQERRRFSLRMPESANSG